MPDKKIYSRNQLTEIIQGAQADGKIVGNNQRLFRCTTRRSSTLPASRPGARRPPRCRCQQRRLSSRALKGENRPLVPADERAEMLAGLGVCRLRHHFS